MQLLTIFLFEVSQLPDLLQHFVDVVLHRLALGYRDHLALQLGCRGGQHVKNVLGVDIAVDDLLVHLILLSL